MLKKVNSAVPGPQLAICWNLRVSQRGVCGAVCARWSGVCGMRRGTDGGVLIGEADILWGVRG